MYYYAYVNSTNTVTNVYAMPTELNIDGYVAITEDQYTNGNLVGKIYDPNTNTFSDPPIWIGTTDELQYKDTNYSASDVFDEIDVELGSINTALGGKADSTDLHSHTNKTVLDTITSDNIHSHTNKTVLDGITSTKVSQWDNAVAGSQGDSAYDIAVDNGFTGTEAQWLASLQGADGQDGTDGTDGEDGTTVVVGTTTTGEAGTNANVTSTLNTSTNTLTLNFTIPQGEAGASGSSDTAAQVLEKIKTVDGAGSGLDADTLDGVQANGFALVNHNHNDDYAAIDHTHTGYAAANHTHTGYAATSHTHAQSDITGLSTALDGKANTSHTHSGYATTTALSGLSDELDGKADSSHTHAQADISGLTSALNGKSDTNHTHTSFSSAINVAGAIKSNNVQVGFNSGSDTTLGSNSYPTNVAGTQVTLNGTKVYSPNIYPRNSGSFTLGAQSNRWSGIYSTVAVNVSSDERLKENIKDIDVKTACDFIKNVDVKHFNYVGNEGEKIGIIAQQLIGINKDFAKYFVEMGDNGYYGVTTSDLVFPLIIAVQQLAKKVEELSK